jgi:hypothetical protein
MEPLNHEILLYSTPDGAVRVEVVFVDETFWLTQKKMAELFGVNVRTVNEHLGNIFISNELQKNSTIRKFRIVQTEGTREVAREVEFYNLDAIIAVGYRVNSRQATQFRIWATQVLREFLVKGFVLDDERLKQGKRFGKDYFDELLKPSRDRHRVNVQLPSEIQYPRLLLSHIGSLAHDEAVPGSLLRRTLAPHP